jgi:hypothetical protein
MRLEGLCQLKNSINSLGFEPATFRLVARCNFYKLQEGNAMRSDGNRDLKRKREQHTLGTINFTSTKLLLTAGITQSV